METKMDWIGPIGEVVSTAYGIPETFFAQRKASKNSANSKVYEGATPPVSAANYVAAMKRSRKSLNDIFNPAYGALLIADKITDPILKDQATTLIYGEVKEELMGEGYEDLANAIFP